MLLIGTRPDISDVTLNGSSRSSVTSLLSPWWNGARVTTWNAERPFSMTSAGSGYSGYTALPQDDVSEELTRMAPRASPPQKSVIFGSGTSGMWRRSDVGQLPVSFSSDIELDELTSASTTTTLTTMTVSPPPHLIAGDNGCPMPAASGPWSPCPAPAGPWSLSPSMFQVGNSPCTVPATSHVKRQLG